MREVTPTVRIVRGDISRLDELEPLFKAMHEHHRAGRPQASDVRPLRSGDAAWARRREHYRTLFEGVRGHLLIAEEGVRAIGYAVVSEGGGQATLATGDRVAELETLSVLPEWRGDGVGSALMDAAYELVRELGVEELMLYLMDGNDDALRFYERRGLRPYLTVLIGPVPLN